MFSILIGLAIGVTGLILFMRWWDNAPRFRGENALMVVVVILTVLAMLGAVLLLGMLAENPPTVIQENTTRTDIVAIKDNTITESHISGGIFVVSGYISEEPVYFFYKRSGSGFIQDYVKARGITIYEDTEPGIGYILTTKVVTRVEPTWKKKHLHWLVFTDEQSRATTAEIHVPKGTVIQEFVLDAE